MKLNELIDKLDLRVLSPAEDMEREVRGGYTSDLLSDVMGNAEADTVWITLQVHRNVVAVAALKEVAVVRFGLCRHGCCSIGVVAGIRKFPASHRFFAQRLLRCPMCFAR